MNRPSLTVIALLSLAPAVAHGQDTQGQPADNDEGAYHTPVSKDIVVSGLLQRNQADILSGTTVLSGDVLDRQLRPTIGETLARQPGVSATSFGPNASRPVLRGFQGERVRVLTDGIGSFDVSNTSVDHAVAINPLTADRIEVLRGPSALLYGSSAIGGVVNVIDSRIPRRVPDEPVHIDAIATYGSAADERSATGEIEAPITLNIVVHLDGSYTKTDDLRIGGNVLAPRQRAEAAASGDAEIADLANLKDRLPNSAAESWEVAGGIALITEGGNLGFSVSRLDNLYGVPERFSLTPHDHDHEGEEGEDDHGHSHEQVRLHIRQTRADMRAEVTPQSGFFYAIRFRAGFADYEHEEIEPTGEVGTTFFNQSAEARLELVQAKRGGWDGAFGAQMFVRDFNVVGEEKFLPRNTTEQFGLFTLQSLDLGAVRLEAGARLEHTSLSATADEDLLNPAYDRDFTALSGSLGASIGLAPRWRLGLNISRSVRAPSAEELFARGNHAGTQAFELGNPNFRLEKSWGVEATLRGSGPGYSVSASAYHTWFKDYIYETQVADDVCLSVLPAGSELEFPCYAFSQADARYYGFEVEGSVKVAQLGGYALNVDGVADYVHAQITGSGPAPRIPPLRLLGGVEVQGEWLTARAEVEHSFEQDRVTEFETPTDGFTLVNASISYKPWAAYPGTSVLLSANNIFDVDARRHASVLKDFAPLAGRDIRVSLRFSL